MTGRCFIGGCLAVVAGPEIRSALRVFVLPEIFVISVTISDFANLVTLFPENDKLLVGPGRCGFRFVETRERFAKILDLTGREPLESLFGHDQKGSRKSR